MIQEHKEGIGKHLRKPSSPCMLDARLTYVRYTGFGGIHHSHQLSKPRGPGRPFTSLGDLQGDQGEARVSGVLCHVMTYDE